MVRRRRSTACIVLGIVLVAGACEGTPSDPSSPSPNLVVTGVVTGDGQPLADTYVQVRTSGSLTTLLALRTDATGRYRAEFRNTTVFSTLMVWVTAVHDTYPFQPCAAWHEQSGPGERTVDVRLTAARRGEGAGRDPGDGRRNVTGTVYMIGPAGKQPVADVDVGVGWGVPTADLSAWTETDAAGRFSVCQLPVNRQLSARALLDVRQPLAAFGSVPPGGDADIEMILERERP